MYKHIGKHNNKKVVLLFREVPGEDHMCLVAYSDLLPRSYHDEVMRVLESPVGQQADNFSDALFRSLMPDGRNCLQALHTDGLMKKVPTNQVTVTPTTNSSVRLDELNNILKEMATGEAAVKRLADLDSSTGFSNKRKGMEDVKEVGAPKNSRGKAAAIQAPIDQVLSDADLAKDRIRQAETMKASAQQLLSEAERLITEAAALDPTTAKNATPTKKKAAPKVKKD